MNLLIDIILIGGAFCAGVVCGMLILTAPPVPERPKLRWYSEPFARNNRLVIQHPEPKGSVTIGEGQTIDDIKRKIK